MWNIVCLFYLYIVVSSSYLNVEGRTRVLQNVVWKHVFSLLSIVENEPLNTETKKGIKWERGHKVKRGKKRQGKNITASSCPSTKPYEDWFKTKITKNLQGSQQDLRLGTNMGDATGEIISSLLNNRKHVQFWPLGWRFGGKVFKSRFPTPTLVVYTSRRQTIHGFYTNGISWW